MNITLNCPVCGIHASKGKNHCEGWGKNARDNCAWITCTCDVIYNTKSGGHYKP